MFYLVSMSVTSISPEAADILRPQSEDRRDVVTHHLDTTAYACHSNESISPGFTVITLGEHTIYLNVLVELGKLNDDIAGNDGQREINLETNRPHLKRQCRWGRNLHTLTSF